MLDPYNITISNAANSGMSGFIAAGNDSVLNAGTLLTALGSANVVVSTGAVGSAGSQAGNITVAAPLAWNTNASLTLQAAGSIAINAGISAAAGGLTLSAGGDITATGAVSVARFNLNAGDWVQNSPSLPGFAAGDFRLNGGTFFRITGGLGSVGNPFMLTDVYGLQGINTLPSVNYALANDIDASGTIHWNGGQGFRAITPFYETFDGQGHVIDRLTINRPGEVVIGLFGVAGGTVSNLGLTNVNVTGSGSVGAVVGRLSAGALNNVYATGTVRSAAAGGQTGGLVGWNDTGTIRNSWADVTVTGFDETGGLVGRLRGATISDSYALGAVTGRDGVGGMVGTIVALGNINRSYSTGSVTGTSNLGGLVGGTLAATATSSFWDTATSGQASSMGGNGRTTAQLRTAATYTGFDFTNIWFQAGDMRPILRSEAGAAVGGVYTISNLHQLALMGANLVGSYVLDRDIDASATIGSNAAGIFGSGGFAPVGSDATPFGGVLDGSGHSITGLVINRPSQNDVGLIGYLGAGGNISNLNIVGGTVTGASVVGGLVGYNLGTVNNSTSSAAVTSNISGVGGIAGINGGTIDRSSATGAISGANNIGGLVGQNVGTITRSYATGTVIGAALNSGGLVGLNNSGISDSYATGSVTSSGNRVGGIAGSSTNGIIQRVYATGAVSGLDYVGGLIGYLDGPVGGVDQAWASGQVTGTFTGGAFGYNLGLTTTSNVYFDTQTTGQTIGSGSGVNAGVGLTTAQARNASSYSGFNFGTDWYHTADMRPILRAEAAPAVGGTISIRNLHQLQLMNLDLGANYQIVNDIDATATAGSNASGIFGAGGFSPLVSFSGQFDGGGYAISGLTINRPSTNNVGLFGDLAAGGMIRDIALVGGSIRGGGEVGALVGYNRGTISDASSSALVTAEGAYDVGGLVGANDGGSISGSSATGNVINNNAGGYVGGLVGWNLSGGTISNSFASGSVTSTQVNAIYVGGLVGRVQGGGSVSNSFAMGAVSGAGSHIGGLIGINDGTLSNVYATGSVTGSAGANLIGGLLGVNAGGGTVTNAYATGLVSGPVGANIGGVAGYNNGSASDFSNVYWNTATTGRALATGGGAVTATGLTTAQMQDLSSYRTTFAGFDFDTVWTPPNQAGQGGSGTAYYPQLAALSNTVIISGLDVSRSYGDANPNFGSPIVSVTGLRTGDFLTGLGTLTTTATATSNVGRYSLTFNGVSTSGNSEPAYRVVQTGQLSVTQRAVTVTADNQGRAYGDANSALTYTNSSLGAGAALTGALATTASAGSNVGAYAITQGGLTNAANSNYVITYVGGNLTVTPRAITVTANGMSRVYGDANPALTYSAGGSGLVNGDTLTGALATAATAGSNIGSYAITQGSLTNAANSNYAITYVGGNVTVTPRAITVTANGMSRVYGDANPALTYSAGGSGLVNGDTLTGALATAATAGSNIGSYAITQGSLTNAANSNYAITYVGGNLAVTPRPITVTADALSRVYGNANPSLTYSVGGRGLTNDDTLAGALSTTATASSNVGNYAITQGGLTNSANPNYAITYIGGNLTVTPRSITVTANALSRQQGAVNPLLTYLVGGDGLVNGDVLSGSLVTDANDMSLPGLYDIQQGDLNAGGNYALDYVGANLTVLTTQSPVPIPVPVPTANMALNGSLIDGVRNDITPLPWSQLPIGIEEGLNGREATGVTLLISDPRYGDAFICMGPRDVDCD